jgi:hypothetical protein
MYHIHTVIIALKSSRQLCVIRILFLLENLQCSFTLQNGKCSPPLFLVRLVEKQKKPPAARLQWLVMASYYLLAGSSSSAWLAEATKMPKFIPQTKS